MRTSTWWLLAGLLLSSPAKAACPPEGTDPASLQVLREQKFAVPDDVRAALVAGLPACLADPDPALRDGVAYEGLSTWLRAGQVDVAQRRALRDRLIRSANRPTGGLTGATSGSTISITNSAAPRKPPASAAATPVISTSTAVPSANDAISTASGHAPRPNCSATSGATASTGSAASSHCAASRAATSSASGVPVAAQVSTH